MLEKIGLPSKPSVRGNNWVVDASHCQGCSSQFTFINRKHHCRRCGGLFCNSCSVQRMVLRGQGDSPVRICDPCKTLEEAARFELRYGHRTRLGKGISKSSLKSENEILSDILGGDEKDSLASGMGSSSKTVSSVGRAVSLNAQDGVSIEGGEKVHRSNSVDVFDRPTSEREPISPEDLRRQAVEEKKKYKVLKGEGKPDEALRAFKRGKELERQADALEISQRRSRRKAFVSQDLEEVQNKDDTGGSRRGSKVARLEGKEKDDLVAELRELGWSNMDMQNEDKKRTSTSLEGEFSSLLSEVSEKTKSGKGSNLTTRSQVLVHKKKALQLKREGNLEEAKEELKRAKVLDKQLEEQELLAGADDSDDEVSALIRSMDRNKQDLSLDMYEQNRDFDLSSLLGAADHIIDGNFDVTDEDMEDPDIAATLKSLGWADDTHSHERNTPEVVSADKEALSNEILSLKREALSQKRAGNVSEAMSLLKKAKLLERDLENLESQGDSTNQAASNSSTPTMLSNEKISPTLRIEAKSTPRKSKLMIQKELIGLKKKALALKREGRLEEAEEELKKGKMLEQQLEEMDIAPLSVKAMTASTKVPNSAYDNLLDGDEEDETVTDQDMNDPAYLSLLKNLGWQEENNDHLANIPSESHTKNDNPEPIDESPVLQPAPVVAVMGPRRSRAELQRELLGLKRKALALRRQGESEEAEEVMRNAKDIESQIAEMEQPMKEVPLDVSNVNKNKNLDEANNDAEIVTDKDMHDPTMLSILKNLGWNDEQQENLNTHEKRNKNAAKSEATSDTQTSLVSASVKKSKGEIQRELLNLKRRALALRRKGEIEEAEEVLNTAKVLEAQLEELDAPKQINMKEDLKDEKSFGSSSNHEERGNVIGDLGISQGATQVTSGPNSNFFELSSDGESMRIETGHHGTINSDLFVPFSSPLIESTTVPHPGNLGNLSDLLTGDDWGGPQMSTAEKHENVAPRVEKSHHNESKPVVKHESVERKDDAGIEKHENLMPRTKLLANETNPGKENASYTNDMALKQEILSRKRKAVALKREGKLAEAREELRQAKLLEKQSPQDTAKSTTGPANESVAPSNASPVNHKERGSSSTVSSKPLSSRERFKLQQESLSHKRQAMKLRREGRTEEADAELELAKSLEAQLEESLAQNSSSSAADGEDAENDLGVEDFLDPQLLSALRAIGIDDARAAPRFPDRPQPPRPVVAQNEVPRQERVQLEEQIKSEKLKALHLKRLGKQAEALDVLRNAKLLEKKLNSLS